MTKSGEGDNAGPVRDGGGETGTEGGGSGEVPRTA
jgi:hypothetical protein